MVIGLAPEEEARRRQLYWRGLNDVEIGKEIGKTKATVRRWRVSRGLISNYKYAGHLTEDEKTIIRMLHGFDLTITGIANIVKRPLVTVLKFCGREGLDTSMTRAQRIIRSEPRDAILQYLEENGPTTLKELVALKILGEQSINDHMRREIALVERFQLKGGGWLFKDPSNKVVYSLRDDPRIIDFVAERLAIAPTTFTEAGRITRNLGEQLGRERAREVVKRLGYQYGRKGGREK